MEILGIIGLCLTLAGCLATTQAGASTDPTPVTEAKAPPGSSTIVLGGGCFWCLEPLFERLKGVSKVEVGYAGGKSAQTTYEEVCTGRTGHAEVIKVWFDPKAISGEDLLRVFFTIHDPTTLNRQGPDAGTQYRSVVFYGTEDEKARAERIIAEITGQKLWPNKIVTTLEPLRNYVRGEEYHQDYYEKFNKASSVERVGMNAGYCQVIISPKIAEFRKKFAHLLKP